MINIYCEYKGKRYLLSDSSRDWVEAGELANQWRRLHAIPNLGVFVGERKLVISGTTRDLYEALGAI